MKEVDIHCSDSYFGNNMIIDKWHKEKDFDEIGYNYIILNGLIHSDYFDPIADGLIETGRRVDKLGAHCKGHNDAIGICLIGESGKFTKNQINSLIGFLKKLKEIYKGINVVRHSDNDPVNKSFCPGISDEEFEDIKSNIL